MRVTKLRIAKQLSTTFRNEFKVKAHVRNIKYVKITNIFSMDHNNVELWHFSHRS